MLHEIINETLNFIQMMTEILIPLLLFYKCIEMAANNLIKKKKNKASKKKGINENELHN